MTAGGTRGDALSMCLGIPGRVVEVVDADGRLARVDVSGVGREVSLAFCPEAGVGDWVLVHVGFGLARIDEAEAERTLALLAEAIAAEDAPA